MNYVRYKFPQLKLFVIICYLSVFTSPGVKPISLAQASPEGYTKKEINSPIQNIPKPIQPKDLIAVPTKDIPIAHEATISGIVLDDLGNPLVGASVLGTNPLKTEETFQTTTDAQGKYNLSVVFKGKAEETIQDFQVDIFKEGYTPKQEEAEVVATRVEGLGTSILKTLDTKVTLIGPSGGTHTNSRGDVQVVVPAGALTENIDFRTTLFDHSKELPGPLPETSFFTYSGEFDAEESEFGEEVTVKIANTLGFAPGTEIPIGYYNEETRVWEDSGQMSVVDPTGAWVQYDTTHFSTPDCNLPALPPPEAQGPTGSTEGPVENHSAQTNINRDDMASNCNASKIDMHTGNLYQEHFLPILHAMNQDITLEFAYNLTTAKPSVLLATQTDLDSLYSLRPETQSAKFEIEGISQSATFKNTFGKNAERFLWDGKNAKGELVSTGSYPYKITLANDYTGTYYTANSFGGDPIEDTGVPTRETIPETTSVTGRVIVNNQMDSAFGSGWGLANSKRLYPDPDGRVLLVEGDGSSRVFGPPHEDIVTANWHSDDVSVLLGNGDGSFQTEKRFGSGDYFGSVAIGDFNGDSYQDLAATNLSSDDVSVLLGNGDGTFQTEKRFGSGDVPYFVAIGDFNEDGDQDLVTANWSSDDVSILLGRGDGNFQTEKRFGSGDEPGFVAVGDFNEDGYQDLVTANWSSDDVSILLGRGDGSFEPQMRFGAGDGTASVAIGNFNGDDYQDLVTANFYDDTVSVLLGNGDGNFKTQMSFGAGNDPASVAIGDFNEDGDQDLVTANYWSDDVSVLLGNGDGTFQTEKRFGSGDGSGFVAVGDFNGDSYQDLATANSSSDDVSVLLGNGDGTFQTEKRFGSGDVPLSVAVGHFNANQEAGEYEALGDSSKLKKNSDGTFKLTEKDGTVFQFNSKGLLTSETDRNGNTIAYTYNADDSLQTIIYPGNVTFTFAYDSSTKKLESVTDSAGRTTQFVVDSSGDLTQIINPDGTSKSYTYDSEHLMTTKTEENGNTTDYVYDNHGRINETQTPEYDVWDGSTTTWERVSTFYFPSDVKGLINDFTEGVGTPENPAPIVDPTTLTDEITGACGCEAVKGTTNAFGSWTESQDGLGRKTKFTRDSQNNVTAIDYPNGRDVDMTYDGKGNVLTVKDDNGTTTTFTYEPTFNQVSSIKDPLGKITTINYDSKGNPIEIVDANATITEMAYDSKGLLISLKQAKGVAGLENTTTFEYGPTTGNLVKTTDPLAHETVLTYDSAGNLRTVLDAEGKTTTTDYDPQNNNLTSVEDHSGNISQYQYDDLGNLTEVTDPKLQTTTFTYNELHLLSSILNPLNKLKQFTYDSERRLGRIVDAKNQTIKFEYDAANQLTKKYLPEETLAYTYDTGGNLTSVRDTDSNISFTFDAMNRLTKAQTLSGGIQPTTSISYAYDNNNNRATMVDVQSTTFKYVYDNLNRLIKITNSAGTTTFGNYAYDVLSRRTQLTYPNTALAKYGYDLASQLTSLINKTGSTTNSSFSYTYNDVGYRDTMTTLTGQHNYTYDDLYRLSAADHPDSTDESYSYDEVGNRLSSAPSLNPSPQMGEGRQNYFLSPRGRGQGEGASATWSYNTGNQLTDDGTYTYEYDNNGNLTKRTKKSDSSITTYTYNSENQLTQITSGSNTFKYAYDGLGRRIQKDVNGTITKYVYDNEDIVAEYSGTSTTPAATYLHGPGIDEPITMSRGGSTYYYHADGLGSITELTNSTGAVSQSYKYDAFGNIISQTGTLINPFTYTGREFDSESGLLYYRARYMDPRIGRFLREDPIPGFLLAPQTLNHFPYVGNNPVNYKDPNGEWIWPVIVIGSVVYLGYNKYLQYKNAEEKYQIAVEAKNALETNLTPETYQQFEKDFCALGGALVEAGASVPGTSISGPLPTSGLDIVVNAAVEFITNLLSGKK